MSRLLLGRAFLRELKRRKIIQSLVVYLVVCFGGLQMIEILSWALEFDPAKPSRYMIVIVLLGFPFAFAFAWFFQVSTDGIMRTEPFVEHRTLDNIAPVDERRREVPARGPASQPEHLYPWVIEFQSGPLAGQRYGVDGDITIGRTPECDLTLPLAEVSRQHALLSVRENRLYIEDRGSANGTFVNSRAINGETELNHDDIVGIVKVEIRIKARPANLSGGDTTIIHEPS